MVLLVEEPWESLMGSILKAKNDQFCTIRGALYLWPINRKDETRKASFFLLRKLPQTLINDYWMLRLQKDIYQEHLRTIQE
jgi:hypothetical protein